MDMVTKEAMITRKLTGKEEDILGKMNFSPRVEKFVRSIWEEKIEPRVFLVGLKHYILINLFTVMFFALALTDGKVSKAIEERTVLMCFYLFIGLFVAKIWKIITFNPDFYHGLDPLRKYGCGIKESFEFNKIKYLIEFKKTRLIYLIMSYVLFYFSVINIKSIELGIVCIVLAVSISFIGFWIKINIRRRIRMIDEAKDWKPRIKRSDFRPKKPAPITKQHNH